MSDTDRIERDLRIEAMQLERELKRLDLRIAEQKLAYAPVRMLFLGLAAAGAIAVALLCISRLA